MESYPGSGFSKDLQQQCLNLFVYEPEKLSTQQKIINVHCEYEL
jgi:hypothetical protein